MKRAILIASTVFAASCTHMVQAPQAPAPIVPAQTASQLEARSLDDAGLHYFVEAALHDSVSWPPKELNFELLTLAAFYFSPDLTVARAQVAYAQAGIETARMRPNPVLDLSTGVPSPYLMGLGFAIPILTGGKRGYAIEMAKDSSSDAELQVAELAWTVRGRVRVALLDALAAERNLLLARAAQKLQESKFERTAEQFRAGEVARAEWETAHTSILDAEMATQAAESQIAVSRASLAAAVSVPAQTLSGKQLMWPDFQELPSPNSVMRARVQREAILNRLDVRRALAQYEVAQRRLQLEVARRRPDFNIGPGYQFEEGHSFFAPVLSLTLPLFNHNEGPIAEAEAQRKIAAANLISVQARVLAESDQALSQYISEYKLSAAAEAVEEQWKQEQTPLVQRTVEAGETDWYALNAVHLQSSAAEKAWLDSLVRAQAALGQVEDALQKPLEAADDVPMVLLK
jgi:cobalt-zinc-cadmium efflux system outer membrane protein